MIVEVKASFCPLQTADSAEIQLGKSFRVRSINDDESKSYLTCHGP